VNHAERKLDAAIALLERFVVQKQTQSRRTLREEVSEILRDADFTQELMRKNLPPGSFHEALAQRCPEYEVYDRADREGREFAEAAKVAGARMRGESFEETLKRFRGRTTSRANDADKDDWVTATNRHGTELRRRK
jgi:hypothetical protein